MPKVYADIHDKLMENYLQTSEATIIGTERTMLCLNKVSYFFTAEYSSLLKLLEGFILSAMHADD